MHGRIASARVRPGSADQIAAGWRQMLEAYRGTGAFRGMISLHQPDDDLAVTLTLWSSAEAADAVAAPLRAQSVAAFADVLVEGPTITAYDVLLSDMDSLQGDDE